MNFKNTATWAHLFKRNNCIMINEVIGVARG